MIRSLYQKNLKKQDLLPSQNRLSELWIRPLVATPSWSYGRIISFKRVISRPWPRRFLYSCFGLFGLGNSSVVTEPYCAIAFSCSAASARIRVSWSSTPWMPISNRYLRSRHPTHPFQTHRASHHLCSRHHNASRLHLRGNPGSGKARVGMNQLTS